MAPSTRALLNKPDGPVGHLEGARAASRPWPTSLGGQVTPRPATADHRREFTELALRFGHRRNEV
eukprot:14128608-Alexandrium_andersonii.AAC.1